MNYESIRSNAIRHRRALTASLLLTLALTTSAGLLFAGVEEQPTAVPYSLRIQVDADAAHHRKTLRLEIIDASTSVIVTSPLLTIADKSNATISSGELPGRPAFTTTVDDSRQTATLVVTAAGAEIERRAFHYETKASHYVGEPITLNVDKAEIHDLMKTFGALTGYTVDIAPEASGTVTLSVTREPWDQVLDRIATQTGLDIRVEGKTIHVRR